MKNSQFKLLIGLFFLIGYSVNAQNIKIDNQLACDIHVRVYAGPQGSYADCPTGSGCGTCCTSDFCIPATSGLITYSICAGANAQAVSVRVTDSCSSISCIGTNLNVSPTGCFGWLTPPQTIANGCPIPCSQANMTITWTGSTIVIN